MKHLKVLSLVSFLDSFKSISFVYLIIESDPIDSLFEICQSNELQVGLTLEEIMQEICLDTINQWFGLTEKEITCHNYFAAIDINNDNLVTKMEIENAVQTLDRRGRKPAQGWGRSDDTMRDC